MIKRTTYFAAGILACLVVSCSSIMSDNETVAIRRPLDDKAVRVPLKTPVAPGRAKAFFKLDTGGDQMTLRPKETGLVVVVRIGGDEYRQTIASCKDPGIGSALGGGTSLTRGIFATFHPRVDRYMLRGVLPTRDIPISTISARCSS